MKPLILKCNSWNISETLNFKGNFPYLREKVALKCVLWIWPLVTSLCQVEIEAISVMSEYPQDGGLVCCCYDYRVYAQLQNSVVCCVLHVKGCVMSDAWHAQREYLQDGSHGKISNGLYSKQNVLRNQLTFHCKKFSEI